MPYFLRTHPCPIAIDRMKQLAALRYMEAHDDTPKDIVVNEDEEVIIVSGHYVECFTFWEFLRD